MFDVYLWNIATKESQYYRCDSIETMPSTRITHPDATEVLLFGNAIPNRSDAAIVVRTDRPIWIEEYIPVQRPDGY